MLDGAAKIKPMLAEAQRLEMPAVGMTDHGNMFGASEFYNKATEAGIKPIIGVEAYIAPGVALRHQAHHLGRSGPEGRRRLGQRRLHAHDDGRRERDRAAQPVQAVVAGVVRGPARQVAADGRRDHRRDTPRASSPPPAARPARCRPGCGSAIDREALEAAAKWREIFGPDNYFLELMDHGLSIEQRVREGLLEIGRKLGIPPLATNDCHYVTRDAAHNHEALLCVQTGKTLSDPNRFKFDGDGYYLKSAAEMRADLGRPGARRLRLDAADRRAGAALRRRLAGPGPDAGLPGARRPRPGVLAAPRGAGGAGAAVPRRRAGRVRRPRRLRDRGHLRQGLSVVLPHRRRPDQLRTVGRHPGRARAAGRRRARWSPTRCGSPTSTRSSTGCCSSASSTPSARRCPISTSTSTTAAAARWCATPPTSGAATGSPRSSPSAPSKRKRR